MTTTTPCIDDRPRPGSRARRAFTLAEVMIAATLSALVLTGVLSALLLISRSGYNASNYSAAEAEIQRGLDTFAEEVRQASDVRWLSRQCITLTIPTATDATQFVTYAYDADRDSGTYACFCRQAGAADSGAIRQVLVRAVESGFAFDRYKLEQPGVTDNVAANDLETKLIQLTMRTRRTGMTTVDATQSAISARFVLRNKRVAN